MILLRFGEKKRQKKNFYAVKETTNICDNDIDNISKN